MQTLRGVDTFSSSFLSLLSPVCQLLSLCWPLHLYVFLKLVSEIIDKMHKDSAPPFPLQVNQSTRATHQTGLPGVSMLCSHSVWAVYLSLLPRVLSTPAAVSLPPGCLVPQQLSVYPVGD